MDGPLGRLVHGSKKSTTSHETVSAAFAVLNPAAGDWLYFVSTNPNAGITKFASSYSEFLKYRAEFQNWYRENN